MYNKVIELGRLVYDPDLRYTSNNKAVANFTLAINKPFRNDNGEQDVDFIDFTIWGKQAENLCKYQKKGNRLLVEGSLATSMYEKDGIQRKKTYVNAYSITYLESKEPGFTSDEAKEVYEETRGRESIDIDPSQLPF